MGAPRSGPCTAWASTDDICSPCDDYAFPAGLLSESIDIASSILFELSGRQFPGSCTATVRPCTKRTAEAYGFGYGDPTMPGYTSGVARIVCGCQRRDSCGCGDPDAITLGGYPVTAITSVKVDGVTLDASRYRVDDYRWLVRLADADGRNPGWPCCQRLDLASTEDETFEVAFTYGRNVRDPFPLGRPDGVRAAAKLACEFALACQPEFAGKCQLSQRVQQVTRQGVTVVMDRLDAIREDLTGIPEVDLFLKAVNPKGLRRRATVFSPDTGRRVRRVGT